MRFFPLAFAFACMVTSLVEAAPVLPLEQDCLIGLKKNPAWELHRPTAADFMNCPPSSNEVQIQAVPADDNATDPSAPKRRRDFNPTFLDIIVDFSDRTTQSLASKGIKHAVFGTPFIPSAPGTQTETSGESKAGGLESGKQ